MASTPSAPPAPPDSLDTDSARRTHQAHQEHHDHHQRHSNSNSQTQSQSQSSKSNKHHKLHHHNHHHHEHHDHNGMDTPETGSKGKLHSLSTTSNLLRASGQTQKARARHYLMISTLLFALIIALASLFSILMLPTFVSHQISKKLVLKNNSFLLERWAKPNVPMFFKVWVFDVQNADQVMMQRGIKPELREKGPFVFRMRRRKDVLSFQGDNLFYAERKLYNFVPEMSCCSINDTVTVPNIPLIAVVDRAMGVQLPLVNRLVPRLINRAIQSLREKLYVRRQVGELLFDGYDVELLKIISRVGSLVGLAPTQQRFAILKGKNNTWRQDQDGIWAINTGERDPRKFGKVSSWNSYTKLPFWAPGSQCNTINGSDGSLFAPPISKVQPLYIFNQEICRTVRLRFERDSEIRTIQALRFGLDPTNFAKTVLRPPPAPTQPSMSMAMSTSSNPTNNNQIDNSNINQMRPNSPGGRGGAGSASQWQSSGRQASPNASFDLRLQQQQQQPLGQQRTDLVNPFSCFCDRKPTTLDGVNICEYDGLIDMSRCNKQTQAVFGSMPHFYRSDARLLEQVTGLQPNESKHATYVDIEPNTGVVLGGQRRVQLNVIVKHNNEIEGFENIRDAMIPLVWFEESAMIPEETALKFKSMFTDKVKMINNCLVSLLIGALILFLIDMKLLMSARRKSVNWKPQLLDNHHIVHPHEYMGTGGATSGGHKKARHHEHPFGGALGDLHDPLTMDFKSDAVSSSSPDSGISGNFHESGSASPAAIPATPTPTLTEQVMEGHQALQTLRAPLLYTTSGDEETKTTMTTSSTQPHSSNANVIATAKDSAE